MPLVTSHILDSITGKSATGIRVRLDALTTNGRVCLFEVQADQEGRVSESVDTSGFPDDTRFELIFASAEYFAALPVPAIHDDNMDEIVIRMRMPEKDKRYHLPVVLSPRSYTVWRSS